jgi:hypothetical protein
MSVKRTRTNEDLIGRTCNLYRSVKRTRAQCDQNLKNLEKILAQITVAEALQAIRDEFPMIEEITFQWDERGTLEFCFSVNKKPVVIRRQKVLSNDPEAGAVGMKVYQSGLLNYMKRRFVQHQVRILLDDQEVIVNRFI